MSQTKSSASQLKQVKTYLSPEMDDALSTAYQGNRAELLRQLIGKFVVDRLGKEAWPEDSYIPKGKYPRHPEK